MTASYLLSQLPPSVQFYGNNHHTFPVSFPPIPHHQTCAYAHRQSHRQGFFQKEVGRSKTQSQVCSACKCSYEAQANKKSRWYVFPLHPRLIFAIRTPGTLTAGIGCRTCKDKRLKCDETKPVCQQCDKKGVQCEGYEKVLKWRPQEDTFKTKPTSPKPRKSLFQMSVPDG